ncbi:hypothetical protein DFJ73DRAFT_779130 [Zopfochytrium polystomum]|nr:hypothetical protein DFJ73DRAFT_779130 [Zopfochytrium polystomum]
MTQSDSESPERDPKRRKLLQSASSSNDAVEADAEATDTHRPNGQRTALHDAASDGRLDLVQEGTLGVKMGSTKQRQPLPRRSTARKNSQVNHQCSRGDSDAPGGGFHHRTRTDPWPTRDGHTEVLQWWKDSGSSLPCHRFLIAAITAGSKSVSDIYCTNTHFAKVGGLTLQELNVLEMEFCAMISWRLATNRELLQSYYFRCAAIVLLYNVQSRGFGLAEALLVTNFVEQAFSISQWDGSSALPQ